MSNNKGLTMVSLVITIIVFTILIGVRLIVEVNDNGLISRAEQLKIDTSNWNGTNSLSNCLYFISFI